MAIEVYDVALRRSTSSNAMMDRIIERIRLEKRHYDPHEKGEGKGALLEKDLARAQEAMDEVSKDKAVLELYKKKLEEEKASLAKEMDSGIDRLKRSRIHEVTMERMRVLTAMLSQVNRRFERIWEHQTRRNQYDDKCSLLGQS